MQGEDVVFLKHCLNFCLFLNRLDERPGSKWRPQLSALQFQTLLQNLTAIKIRATFGDTGEPYREERDKIQEKNNKE